MKDNERTTPTLSIIDGNGPSSNQNQKDIPNPQVRKKTSRNKNKDGFYESECRVCGLKLFSKGPQKKLCSRECLRKDQNNLYKQNKKIGKKKKSNQETFCLNCNKQILKFKGLRKYCNDICKKEFINKKHEKFESKTKELGKTKVGAIQEMLVCADLIKRGYDVFRAICSSCPCDIIILKDNKSLRVEVTTGYITSANGYIKIPTKDYSKFDIIAIVLGNGKIVYDPEF